MREKNFASKTTKWIRKANYHPAWLTSYKLVCFAPRPVRLWSGDLLFHKLLLSLQCRIADIRLYSLHFLISSSSLSVVKCGGFFYLCTKHLIRNMEQVNHPQHYTTYDVETLDMMIRIWGVQETISFCKLNAFKYRMRAGHKDNAQQDIDKALWYENKMKELSSCNHE